MNEGQTILFFGENNLNDIRNVVMINVFRKLNYKVKIYNFPYSRFKIQYWVKSFIHLIRLEEIDFIYIGFPANTSILIAKLLTFSNKRVKIIFNPNVLYHETYISDYKKFHKKHPISKVLKYLDKLFIRLADIFITDSRAHKKFYKNSLEVPTRNILVLPVGVNSSIFSIKANEKLLNDTGTHYTNVVFYGSFNPLQGVDVIIKAFNILRNEPIKLYVIGNGPTFKENLLLSQKLNLNNIRFIDWLDLRSLFEFVKSCDISLGIFGGTAKSMIVVPNKVYQSLALGRIVITQDSPAIHEFFVPGKHLELVNPQSPQELAFKIRSIHNNQKFYQKIGENGKNIVEEKYTPRGINNLIAHAFDRNDKNYAKNDPANLY